MNFSGEPLVVVEEVVEVMGVDTGVEVEVNAVGVEN